MKSKPNIDAFLDGGAATEQPKKESSEPAALASGEFRKQMVMQLPVPLINELKRRALDLSLQSGKRVTQQQLVEEALKNYLHR
ncbi:hypothetical protein [Dokdonella soli]|uniref:hypothetical protein n=1 Tax=Dokdonella soli TaxID=529810 RepID=UPI0036128FA2